MPDYILALDQGTTSSRAVLFDADGKVAGSAQHAIRQIFPQPGWVEHNPAELWHSQLTAAREVLQQCGVPASAVRAIGLANQRETTILWDRATGQPMMNAIVWQDRRTAAYCDNLRRDGYGAMIGEKTGLVLDAYFSASKLKWMLDQLPGARQRATRGELAFGTVDSWLVYKLSGAHVTDASNASRTMLFNIHTGRWDDELLALFDIPAAVLPAIVDSSGHIATAAADLLGHAIPITGIAGDQQAATFGQACLQPGSAKNTIGTGSFLLMNVGEAPVASANQLLSTVGWRLGGRTTHLLEGSVFMAGATLQWLRDGLGIVNEVSQIEQLAGTVADADGVVLVPAFSGLGAPHWDPYARGTILGLHRGSTRQHIARAALDGIAYQTVDVLRAIEADSGVPLRELRVDGGGAKSDLLLQLMADALGIPVLRPVNIETTALGAAQLAGLGVGLWSDIAALKHHWQVERCFEPAICDDRRTWALTRWHDAVSRSSAWATV
ncbi:glycerol kinase [Duganella sacchari]|uniref:Glycerol kinase n=1 Tax=Duganella sacchari TaxID=551987 RepID=A0A1M7QH87_9BURK|nr:glycerol kinase GlpK [Duganella sacchari]SHN30375.1 glycerol kinase [Duganella sacchari]